MLRKTAERTDSRILLASGLHSSVFRNERVARNRIDRRSIDLVGRKGCAKGPYSARGTEKTVSPSFKKKYPQADHGGLPHRVYPQAPSGGVSCVAGMVAVPMLILMLITGFYTAFQDNIWVASAMRGVRSAVAPVILSALTGLIKSAFKVPPCIVIAAAMFALYFWLRVSCVWLVIIGAILGLLICEYYERVKKIDVVA